LKAMAQVVAREDRTAEVVAELQDAEGRVVAKAAVELRIVKRASQPKARVVQ